MSDKNNNFMDKYSTEKSAEQIEIEQNMIRTKIAKSIVEWSNNIVSSCPLERFTDEERARIAEAVQSIEERITDKLRADTREVQDVVSTEGAALLQMDKDDVIGIVAGKMCKDRVDAMVVAHTLRGNEDWKDRGMEFSNYHAVANCDLEYEYLYCTPEYINKETEALKALSDKGYEGAERRLEALQKYQERVIADPQK